MRHGQDPSPIFFLHHDNTSLASQRFAGIERFFLIPPRSPSDLRQLLRHKTSKGIPKKREKIEKKIAIGCQAGYGCGGNGDETHE